MKSASLQQHVLETLGTAIVGGELVPGTILTLDELQQRFGVSRTVIRDAVKGLEAQNMLAGKRRVGIVVLPRDQWDLLAPAVIGWRLASPDRLEALREISELRLGIEPTAAWLAASAATAEQATVLLDSVAGMEATARIPDLHAYLEHDIRLHRTLLEASGNRMLMSLAYIIDEALTGRTQEGLMPPVPKAVAVALHRTVVEAVAAHDGATAEAAMREIVTEAQLGAQEMAEVGES